MATIYSFCASTTTRLIFVTWPLCTISMLVILRGLHTIAVRKATSCELLTKQATKKKLYYIQKNKHMFELLLNVGTAGTEALLASGNKFLHACVKEVYRLWAEPHFDTFYQLIIAEALWSQTAQVGKQVVVARTELRAVRRMVRILQVEKLQQSSASSCTHMRTRVVIMEEHYTGCQHSASCDLNSSVQFFYCFYSTLLTLLWSLIAWIAPSAVLSCPRKESPSADNFSGLFGECACIHYFDWSLVQHSQMKPRFHHLLLVRCDWEFIAIFVVSL
jgi:hypothetical protein